MTPSVSFALFSVRLNTFVISSASCPRVLRLPQSLNFFTFGSCSIYMYIFPKLSVNA